MTTALETEIPIWTPGDRIRKALDSGGIGVIQLANYLEISRATVGSWISGRYNPSAASLRMIAMLTGVDYDWLRDGTGDEGVVRHQGLEPRTRWFRANTPGGYGRRRLLALNRQHLTRVAA